MKLIVVGQDHGRIDKVTKQLKSLKPSSDKLDIESLHFSEMAKALDHSVEVLIVDVDQVTDSSLSVVAEARSKGFQGPILLLGYLPRNAKLSDFAGNEKTCILKKPYTLSQLNGIVKNCLDSKKAEQQREQRFQVRELARLEAYGSDFQTETIVNNISKSGVCIEGNLVGIQEGDLLRLHFNFDKIQKHHLLSARVVWLKKESDSKEEAGLEFVSQKDVYQYLLENGAT